MTCRLCKIFFPSVGRKLRYNHLLLERRNLAVVPALGPITVGHVMIVSRDHVLNLFDLDSSAISDYDSILKEISQLPFYAHADLLEAEHGAAEDNSGGACIAHAHVNIIPGFGRFSSMFDETYPVSSTSSALNDMVLLSAPYIFLRGSAGSRMYRADKAPSQAIRRELFHRIGLAGWDWRVTPSHDIIEETIDLWSGNK